MPTADLTPLHRPVLPDETVAYLALKSGGRYIDATLGLGGHSEAILSGESTASVLAIDRDAEAISIAKDRLQRFGRRVEIVQANFADVKTVSRNVFADGIVADLGVSSLQLDSADRGFSFRADAPLDMRMDRRSGPTAAQLLAELPEDEIANLIYRFGEERFSRKIARWIVERRAKGTPIETTRQLAELVERAVRQNPKDKMHPATRTFQALRIAVNGELEILEKFIKDAAELLKIGGRLVIISFHSLEDRIVKQTFQKLSGRCSCPPRMPTCVCGAEKVLEILTRKPVTAGDAEIQTNPRSRSAKLRAAERIS